VLSLGLKTVIETGYKYCELSLLPEQISVLKNHFRPYCLFIDEIMAPLVKGKTFDIYSLMHFDVVFYEQADALIAGLFALLTILLIPGGYAAPVPEARLEARHIEKFYDNISPLKPRSLEGNTAHGLPLDARHADAAVRPKSVSGNADRGSPFDTRYLDNEEERPRSASGNADRGSPFKSRHLDNEQERPRTISGNIDRGSPPGNRH
jgi:hypothetical protein